MKISKLILLMSILIMSGCNTANIPVTKPTPTPIPVKTLSPTLTFAESIATPTSVPLSSNAPWLVFTDNSHLYALNEDGTGLTPFLPELSVWEVTGSPSEDMIAAVTSKGDILSYAVTFIQLPDRKIVYEIPLFSYYANRKADLDQGPSGPLGGIYGIQWSPDGQYLAFVGAIEHSTSSLYVYETKSHAIKLLSQTQYQTARPTWSPDGKWIVYEEVSDFHGWQTQAVWAKSAKDGELKLLFKPTNQTEQKIVGWVENDTFLIADSDIAGDRNIRIVDIKTGSVKDLYAGYYSAMAMGKNGSVAFFPISGAPGAGSQLEPALYLVSPHMPKPKMIEKITGSFSLSLVWDPSLEIFISELPCKDEPEKTIAFDSAGKIMCVTKLKPNPSPNGAWYIVENQPLSIYRSNGEKLGDLPIAGLGNQITWRPDSNGFFVTIDGELSFFSLPSMVFQKIYQSQYRYLDLTWVGIH